MPLCSYPKSSQTANILAISILLLQHEIPLFWVPFLSNFPSDTPNEFTFESRGSLVVPYTIWGQIPTDSHHLEKTPKIMIRKASSDHCTGNGCCWQKALVRPYSSAEICQQCCHMPRNRCDRANLDYNSLWNYTGLYWSHTYRRYFLISHLFTINEMITMNWRGASFLIFWRLPVLKQLQWFKWKILY